MTDLLSGLFGQMTKFRTIKKRSFGVFVLYLCVLAAIASCSKVDTGQNLVSPPILYSTNSDKPIHILAEKQWGADAPSREFWGLNGSIPLAQAASALVLPSSQATGALTLRIVFSGIETSNKPSSVKAKVIFQCVDLTVKCEYPIGERELNVGYVHQETDRYTGTVYDVGEIVERFELKTHQKARLYFFFEIPSHLMMQYVKATLFYGDYTPDFPKKIPLDLLLAIVLAIKLTWLLIPISFFWLYKTYDGIPANTPYGMGMFFIVWGSVVFFFAHWQASLAIGLLIGLSGVFFVFGLATSLKLYTMALMVAWGWALYDGGENLFMRVGAVTLISFYALSASVRRRVL